MRIITKIRPHMDFSSYSGLYNVRSVFVTLGLLGHQIKMHRGAIFMIMSLPF